MERESQGYVERIHTLQSELFQQQMCAKSHDPYSCSDSEVVTNSGLQYSAGSHVDPCSVDNLCAEGASAQTISGERESLSMLPSQPIVLQITESGQTYLFTQECGDPFLKGCTPESKQPKDKHVHVQLHDVQGHSEQELEGSVQGHTEPSGNRFQESVQGHNVNEQIPVSISNPNMHMQLPPPLLQQFQSDQTITASQNPPAGGQTFLVQSMTELLKAQTQMLAAQAQAASIQSLPALAPFTGEESQTQLFDEDFDHWLKSFEE